MRSSLDRRSFLRLASATAAFLARKASSQTSAPASAAQSAPAQPQSAPVELPARAQHATVKSRKNFVGIQVRGFAWVDEGVDQVLDNIQKKGEVNTVWAYTYAYGEQRLKQGSGFPDHGAPLTAANTGFNAGALYDYDPKFFTNTTVKDFRISGYGKFNVIEAVAAKAHGRGMDFFAWDLNNPSPTMARNSPAYAALGEIDINGKTTTNPCFNNPDYRAFLRGKIQSLLIGYPELVDGIAWGCERIGPLDSILGGGSNATCFCQFCQAKARDLGISVDRAKAGFREIIQLFHSTPANAPLDGYFVTFWRILLRYPEVLSWETLWTDSFLGAQAEVYGLGKSIAPQKPFGFHILQNMTFSPFYRAEEDYTKRRDYADFLKLATYNNAGGPRMAAYLQSLSRTIFHDAQPHDFLALYYKMMNYNEAPYDQLASHGLSPDYIAKETKRALSGVAGQTKIYPGIDIDVPVLGGGPKEGDKKTDPDDVKHALEAAFAAGADGVVLSREYVEMFTANLTSAGDTLRAIFAARPAKS
jgi:hypothetical protein